MNDFVLLDADYKGPMTFGCSVEKQREAVMKFTGKDSYHRKYLLLDLNYKCLAYAKEEFSQVSKRDSPILSFSVAASSSRT